MTAARYIFVALFVLGLWAMVQMFSIEAERRVLREDAIELSKIKYGIFNVDEWKRIAAQVIAEKIEEFDLSPGERTEMRRKINAFLTKVITDLKDRFQEENKRGLLGFIKREGATFFGIFEQIERDIPVFTDQIITFMDDPKNREDVKAFLTEKVNTYADNTFSETDYTLHDAILERHGHNSRQQAIEALQARSAEIDFRKKPYAALIYAILGASLVFLIFSKRAHAITLTAIIAIALISLGLGVMLPMIEIDARIDRLSFQLLGEPITFTDQVLYYKSKSILEVVQLMIDQGKADLLAVALLVFSFSVLFPISKMLASLLYLHLPHLRENKVIGFFVFKTGKWSMADVMVVAIFMSYIGFSGIVTEQLSQLEDIAREVDVLTTNKSSLQTGFFMFAGFVVLSLAIAQRLDGMKKVIA